ncbi:fumarylacetoacetate hydrolase family protein [Gracilibacillus sp. YIM 98692]|uniref:fumarylacetoacetate hydrolase family protein n=1 Tax=Gracilibacillus sp. YIM 98692 TaxID=2663532 RepID=UPI0013D2C3BC|nr:fumarylacetoacetate hydrolase family protein [Gracilibacillus sp. YIM 98692]
MKLATVKYDGEEKAAIIHHDVIFLIETLNDMENKNWPSTLFELIAGEHLESLEDWYDSVGKSMFERCIALEKDQIEFAPLYRKPRKIWGVGMNYFDPSHQSLEEISYQDPVSFMKPDTTIIGPKDTIQIPHQSTNTTAEAELAIVIGKECRNISQEEAKNVVAGFTTALDMTEASIHAENQRYLTRAKSFDTFFSFGPEMVTNKEIKDVSELTVRTVHNGQMAHQNKVKNMRYNPWFIVSFHSQVMTLLPGDIILTGTPGAVSIRDENTVEAHIDGFSPLLNRVKQ